jgi:uncharacterized protein with HEPN domain
MLEAATWIIDFTSQREFDDLLNDKLFQSAVERQFEILGEAASHVSLQTQQQWPAIDWKGIKSFRNVIAHEYFRTDYIEILAYSSSHRPTTVATTSSVVC